MFLLSRATLFSLLGSSSLFFFPQLFLYAASLQILGTHLASADACAHLFALQSVLRRAADELVVVLHGGQPEAVLVGEEVAGAPRAVALDERRGPEVFQTGARRHQRLATALCPGRSVH